jgi:hypothetical protein
VLEQPHPTAADQTGDSYTFEKHVSKLKGSKGYADVWKRGFFACEYKGKHNDLQAAYLQLADYREDLENPPLLVVCDLAHFTKSGSILHLTSQNYDNIGRTTTVTGSINSSAMRTNALLMVSVVFFEER